MSLAVRFFGFFSPLQLQPEKSTAEFKNWASERIEVWNKIRPLSQIAKVVSVILFLTPLLSFATRSFNIHRFMLCVPLSLVGMTIFRLVFIRQRQITRSDLKTLFLDYTNEFVTVLKKKVLTEDEFLSIFCSKNNPYTPALVRVIYRDCPLEEDSEQIGIPKPLQEPVKDFVQLVCWYEQLKGIKKLLERYREVTPQIKLTSDDKDTALRITTEKWQEVENLKKELYKLGNTFLNTRYGQATHSKKGYFESPTWNFSKKMDCLISDLIYKTPFALRRFNSQIEVKN